MILEQILKNGTMTEHERNKVLKTIKKNGTLEQTYITT